ncbi:MULTISPECIES: DUF1622 domain-containing protein [Methanobacterium]|jgi:uncharacterized membrane protein|uniref:DUF1622 domain-containing protein n=1 Tax=Methanobacterium veterum TaxID=408577 RepID=A0A9E4ZYF3_9EURY|nr:MULTISPECIES: DUF1622 domain-containing protein [Methanobacterium]MCZ3365888.1 DUF1622 domain-containing protein [Methanobacterium veterum]MCZ3371353.1 DUF1622 domain-containing protein [Methanobacterium veterum]
MVDYGIIIVDIASILSYFGAVVIFYGGIRAAIGVLSIEILKRKTSYNDVRLDFTPKLLIGLEFFIAGDLIKSILEPNLNQVIILAVIVAIRTVVGFSLGREIKELEQMGKK